MFKFIVPALVLLGLSAVLWRGLALDPRYVPSPLVGQPVPPFSLPRLSDPSSVLSNDELKGKPSLLNVWATWCVGCRHEHELLVQIAKTSPFPIYGLNYKDQFKAAKDWLRRLGNPYIASAYDAEGKVGLDLGVYGLPETFVVDANGTIVHKHVGPLTQSVWEADLKPLLQRLGQ